MTSPHQAGVPLYGGALTDELPVVLEHLRQKFGPIAPVEVAPGVGAWVLLGYDLNLAVLRDAASMRHLRPK